MDDFYPPIHEPEDDDLEFSTDQQAFAAYEDAWLERDSTGRTSSDLLTAALQRRKVPACDYAKDTRLHGVLFDSWDRGRRPKRMHGVILKYRLGNIRAAGRELADIFRDTTPEHMKLPEELRPASRWSDRDEEVLAFTPTGTFAARIGSWYDAIDDDERERELPIWLDAGARPERTPVMIGSEIVGHTDLPEWAHTKLNGATKRGKRVVVAGGLWVKLRKNGTYRAREISVVLPDLDD